jgi:hypothetical protein
MIKGSCLCGGVKFEAERPLAPPSQQACECAAKISA